MTDEAATAREFDERDGLAGYRSRFYGGEEALVYLDGNSLGRLPLATAAHLRHVVEHEWGVDLLASFDNSWMHLPERVGDLIGTGLVGAREGEVVVADSTTVNLHKCLSAAVAARPGRKVVVTDRDNFPTDRYVAQAVADSIGGSVRWLDGDPVDGPGVDGLAALLDEDVAVVTLSLVGYRTSALADLAAITELAHDAGALVCWDLSHATGAVPIELETAGVDMAVGCTYKYLNGGPGAPAFAYVRAEHQAELLQPLWGWWGRAEQFAMGPGYVPAAGIRSFLSGSPPVLSLAAVETGVEMVLEAGIGAIRAKGIALTQLAIDCFDSMLAPLGYTLGCPRDPARRGSHVLFCRSDAREVVAPLAERGVVVDFRAPDGVRVGCSPLSTSFADVVAGIGHLAAVTAARDN